VDEKINLPEPPPDDAPSLPEQHDFYKMPAKFGHVPVAQEPMGWDPKRRFEHLYPRVSLPFQVIERVGSGSHEQESNKLFFGDNLHIMRSLPSESIDLIYIDPPFLLPEKLQRSVRGSKRAPFVHGYLGWWPQRLSCMAQLTPV
jgi:hypothetical protein